MQGRPWYGLAILGGAAAFVPAIAMWGFTVDDALIPLRYAHNVVIGEGYRFNPGGLRTDGVTPLPWVPLLAVLGDRDPMVALTIVKAAGVVVWTVTGGFLGAAVARRGSAISRLRLEDNGAPPPDPRRLAAVVALVVVALAFPLGAWAASGMETPVAMGLATAAAMAFARPRTSAVLGGLAAAFRPELVVWALVLASGAAISQRSRAAVPLALGPFVLAALVRLLVFGRVAPLATLAKPSDLAHGLSYAAAGVVFLSLPVLACAPLAIARASAATRSIALAFAAHVVVVVAVGGDWMPYARLLVPVVPSLALVYVDLASVAHRFSTVARGVAAVALGITFAVTAAPAGRHVDRDRRALVAAARPLLADARVVAALDVGWVSASTSASVVDLAGLTDPSIALLSGGHTSKAVDLSMLLDRGVDTIVVYTPIRQVEARITRGELFARRFEVAATLPLAAHGTYTFYRRR